MTFERFLMRSFTALRRGAHRAYLAMCDHLAGYRLRLVVDDEELILTVDDNQVQLSHEPGLTAAELRTTRATIRRLLSGQSTLFGAVLDGSLDLRGTVNEVARLHEALECYLHGAVRCAAFPRLYREFMDCEGVEHARA